MKYRLYAMLAPAGELRLRLMMKRDSLPAAVALRITQRLDEGIDVAAFKAWSFTPMPAVGERIWSLDHRLQALAPGQYVVEMLVDGVPVDRIQVQVRGPGALESARILMGSCFWSKRKDSFSVRGNVDALRRRDLGASVPRPFTFTVLMGDQVYLDLPLDWNGRRDVDLVSHACSHYSSLWFDDPQFRALLQAAPVVMIPDDHELWNNAPFAQAHLPDTWGSRQRKLWLDLGRSLFDFFQGIPALDGETGRSRYLREPPMYAVFLDTRLERSADKDSRRLLSDADRLTLERWKQELEQAPDGSIGLLAIGQLPLLPQVNWLWERMGDAELADFTEEYRRLLDALTGARHPVLILTGDVHYGRATACSPLQGRGSHPLIELVCSPLSLIPGGGPAKPKFKTNERALKQRGYVIDKTEFGIRSSSMVGELSIDPGARRSVYMRWRYKVVHSDLAAEQRIRVLPDFNLNP